MARLGGPLFENNANPIFASPCDMAWMLNAIRVGHQNEIIWNADGLATSRHAPALDKFRIVQSMTPPRLNKIVPPLRVRLRRIFRFLSMGKTEAREQFRMAAIISNCSTSSLPTTD
jgi:hypothetical protein